MRLTIFHTGKVRVDIAIPLHEKNPTAKLGLFRSKKKKRDLPVSSYLIEHDGHRILVDTGWDSKYAEEKPKQFLGMLNKVSKPLIKKEEAIDHRLSIMGIKDSDLDYVIYTHLDFDHTSGTRLVKNAKCFLASRQEIEDASKSGFRNIKSDWEMVTLTGFEFAKTGIGPVGESHDLYGDGRIILVSTPGHSRGHLSVLLNGKDGEYLVIAGDAAYIPESYENKVIPGMSVDDELSLKSLEWLIDCKNDPKCLGVFANHDPSVEEGVIEL